MRVTEVVAAHAPRVDRRAVSTVAGYTIALAVTTLLLTGLVVSAGDFLDTQQERAVRAELEVVGNQLASDLTTADALVRGAADRTEASEITVRLERTLPERVSGADYLIEVRSSELVLSTDTPDEEVTVQVPTNDRVSIATTTIDGGDVVIEFDPDSSPPPLGELEVTDD